jgi:capsular exopolysaccharide synthesis family protein
MITTQQTKTSRRKGDNQFKNNRIILSKYLFHWPLFLLFIFISFAGAYAYIKFVSPVYEISASILVKDEKKSPNEKSEMKELDQSGSAKNAETEIEILRSKNLVSKVVDDLQLWVTYEVDQNFKKKNIYATKPFVFELSAATGKLNRQQLNGQQLEIIVKNKSSFEILNADGTSQTFDFNKPLKNSFGSWVLKPNQNVEEYKDSVITITLNNPTKVSNQFIKSLDVHLLDKAAPTIGLFIADEVPERGKDILNYLILIYNEATSSEEKRTTKSIIDFIDTRLATLTGELNFAEKEVEGYRTSIGLTDINSQSKVYLENVQTNDIKLNEVNVQLNVIEGIERYVNSSSSSESPPATLGITDPSLNSLIEKVSDLQNKRVALLATTPESNPAFEPIDRQIRNTKTAIQRTVQGIKSSLFNSKRQLQSFNNKFESSIKDIPGQERQFVGMKRQQAIKESLYVYLLQKREELALTYASTLVDARIVDEANVGDIKWPRVSLIMALALLMGFGLPFLIIYLRQLVKNNITDKTDIENAIDVPILGELSYENLGKEVVILDNVRHLVGEQIRSLRTNLHYLHNNKTIQIADSNFSVGKGRVTLFTSSISGEGKSFVSSNIAVSLAVSGRKTVLLEMDLRKPKLAAVFNISAKHKGISEFLSSEIDVKAIIQPSGLDKNLDFIGCGDIPTNPSELLEKERLNKLINDLRALYDDIIIDSPPLHLVTDAMIIAKYTDVTLYVIRQGHTGKAELNFIDDIYFEEKLPNMNIVFNGIKKGKYGYGYNYDNSYYNTAALQPSFNTSMKLFLSRF